MSHLRLLLVISLMILIVTLISIVDLNLGHIQAVYKSCVRIYTLIVSVLNFWITTLAFVEQQFEPFIGAHVATCFKVGMHVTAVRFVSTTCQSWFSSISAGWGVFLYLASLINKIWVFLQSPRLEALFERYTPTPHQLNSSVRTRHNSPVEANTSNDSKEGLDTKKQSRDGTTAKRRDGGKGKGTADVRFINVEESEEDDGSEDSVRSSLHRGRRTSTQLRRQIDGKLYVPFGMPAGARHPRFG